MPTVHRGRHPALPLPLVSLPRAQIRSTVNARLHPGHRQQELLVLVAAPLAAHAAGRAGVSRGAHSRSTRPSRRRRSAAYSPVGQGALPAGRRAGDLGFARHLRVPGRAPSRARSSGRRRPAGARSRAQRVSAEMHSGFQQPARQHEHELPRPLSRAWDAPSKWPARSSASSASGPIAAARFGQAGPFLFGRFSHRRRHVRAGGAALPHLCGAAPSRCAASTRTPSWRCPPCRSGSPRRLARDRGASPRSSRSRCEDLPRRRLGARRAARPAGQGPRLRGRRQRPRRDGAAGFPSGRQGLSRSSCIRKPTRSTRSRAPSARPAAATRASPYTPRRTSRWSRTSRGAISPSTPSHATSTAI